MDQDEVGLSVGRLAIAVCLPGHRVKDGPVLEQALEGGVNLAFGRGGSLFNGTSDFSGV
jgi:hypothetical protein